MSHVTPHANPHTTPHTAPRTTPRTTPHRTTSTTIRRPFTHFAALAALLVFATSIGAMYLAAALADWLG